MTDVLVIGGGTNGLAAAALLAKAGKRVVLCEARESLGGLAAADEFHEGFTAAGILQDTSQLSQAVVDALDLKSSGLVLEPERPRTLVLEEGGPGIVLSGDEARTVQEIERVSEKDAAAWREYRAFHRRIAPFLETLLALAPPDTTDTGLQTMLAMGKKAVALRRLGKKDMLEFLRIAPMCVADFVREWFESNLMHSGLSLPAVSGTWLAPWSAGSTLNLLVHEHRSRVHVAGGPPALAEALVAAARKSGVELRSGARVARLLVVQGRVTGVRLEDGDEIPAGRVLATCDPRQTFLRLMPRGTLSEKLEHRMSNFRARGTTAVVRLALSAPLEYEGRPGEHLEYARSGGHIDDLERAFDAVKYRGMSECPALEIHAPAGAAAPTASMLVHFAPYELEGGWTPERAEELGDRAVASLARFAPTVKDTIRHREVLTPVELESRYHTSGGHLHHGEHALDQFLLRPTPETSRTHTPIPGLFLGGSGMHPGGGLTCEPGRLAAQVLGALD